MEPFNIEKYFKDQNPEMGAEIPHGFEWDTLEAGIHDKLNARKINRTLTWFRSMMPVLLVFGICYAIFGNTSKNQEASVLTNNIELNKENATAIQNNANDEAESLTIKKTQNLIPQSKSTSIETEVITAQSSQLKKNKKTNDVSSLNTALTYLAASTKTDLSELSQSKKRLSKVLNPSIERSSNLDLSVINEIKETTFETPVAENEVPQNEAIEKIETETNIASSLFVENEIIDRDENLDKEILFLKDTLPENKINKKVNENKKSDDKTDFDSFFLDQEPDGTFQLSSINVYGNLNLFMADDYKSVLGYGWSIETPFTTGKHSYVGLGIAYQKLNLITKRNFVYQNSFKLISLPFFFGFEKKKPNIVYGFEMGMLLNITRNAEGKFQLPSNPTSITTYPLDPDFSFFDRKVLSTKTAILLTIAFKIETPLSERVTFSNKIGMAYSLSNWYQSDISVLKPKILNINSGLSYSF